VGLFDNMNCKLSVLFQQRFIVHMTMPVAVSAAVGLAYVMSNVCGKKEGKQHRSAQAMKILIFIVLLVYPGLCTAVFTMFLCKNIPGVDDGRVLLADFSVRCNQGEHVMYSSLGFAFGGLYIFGIPTAILVVLKLNRKHLYDKTSPKHEEVIYELGGLYSQYEEKFWWFEIFIMIHKMFMT